MRKYLRWQMPFADIDENQYVVNIYANEAPEGEPKVLVGIGGEGGAFSHNEDETEDPSAPVRTQTATISIANTEGNLNMIDEIMPRDNTKRFVQVCALDKKGTPVAVLWQGFLSSDSFSQEYRSIVNDVEVNINSMLMAMDSVNAQQKADTEEGIGGIVTFKEAIEYALGTIGKMAGVEGAVTDYFVPHYAGAIMEKKINTYDFFSVVNRTFGDREEAVAEGISLKAVLERICTYMHWTARERGTKFYFQDMYDALGGQCDHYRYANGEWVLQGIEPMSVVQMDEYKYMGTGHQKSINRGARYVEVTAKMTNVEELKLPECPYSELVRRAFASFHYSEEKLPAAVEAVVCKNDQYYSHIYLENGKKGQLVFQPEYCEVRNIESATNEEVADAFPNIPDVTFTPDYPTLYGGAYLARLEVITDPLKFVYHKMQSGVMLSMLPTDVFMRPVFRMVSPKVHSLVEGYLHISTNMMVGGYCGGGTIWLKYMMDSVGKDVDRSLQMKIYLKMAIRCGNKYYKNGQWNEIDPRYPFWNNGAFNAEIEGSNFKLNIQDEKVDEENGLLLPITKDDNLSGQIEIVLFPNAVNAPTERGSLSPYTHNNIVTMAFMSQLDVKYIRPYSHLLSDASENVYMDITGFDFNETESISTDIATYKGNMAAPSIVLEPDLEPMEALGYLTGRTDEEVRYMKPEMKALEDMRKFYSAPRRVIDLEVRPMEDVAPMLIVKGYDGKTYYPISEQHDWILNKTTMRCLEIGNDEQDTDPDNDEPLGPPVVPPQFEGGGDHTGDGSGGYEDGRDPDDDHEQGEPGEPGEPDWGDPDDDGRDDGPDGDDRDGPDYD